MKSLTLALVLLVTGAVNAQTSQSCLLVRGGENHRVRNAAVFGLLTGGVGLAGGLILSSTRYDRIDAIGDVPFKDKYSPAELKKMNEAGVHIVVKGKNEEVGNTRTECGLASISVPNQPVAVPITPAAYAQATQPITSATDLQPAFVPAPQPESLGDAARRIKQHNACLSLAKDNPAIACK